MLFSWLLYRSLLQRRVLYGVPGAIVLRTIAIFAGSWLISQFDWLLKCLGAFLSSVYRREDGAGERGRPGIGDKPLVR